MANFSFSSNGAMPNSPTQPQFGQGSSPIGKALNGAQGMPSVPLPPSMPLIPPMHQAIKSHTITHPDGTSVVQTYHNPMEHKTPGLLGKSGEKSAPTTQTLEPKMVGDKHHVPFKKADGTVGFINANGDVI